MIPAIVLMSEERILHLSKQPERGSTRNSELTEWSVASADVIVSNEHDPDPGMPPPITEVAVASRGSSEAVSKAVSSIDYQSVAMSINPNTAAIRYLTFCNCPIGHCVNS